MSFTDERRAINNRFNLEWLKRSDVYVSGLSLAINSVTKTVTRGSGSFVSEGVTAGEFIKFSGFSNVGNNQVFKVSIVTALALTMLDPRGYLVTEAAGGDEVYGFPAISVYYEGVDFEPEVGKSYVTCQIIPGAGFQATLGSAPWYRYAGIIQNSIFIPVSLGTRSGDRLMDRAAEVWRRAQFFEGLSGLITCQAPHPEPFDQRTRYQMGTREGRYRWDLSTPYHRDINFGVSPVSSIGGGLSWQRRTVSGVQDGINTVFTVPTAPDSTVFQLYVNGLLRKPGTYYTLSGNVITFITPPLASDTLEAFF